MDRPLTPDEAALWARVLETVRPLRVVKAKPSVAAPGVPRAIEKSPTLKAVPLPPAKLQKVRKPPPLPSPPIAKPSARKEERKEYATLDGSWDRQLSRGLISPDRTIDLHGHNLSTAYATLDVALDRAIRDGARVILLVTGKPPRPESERPHARGAIRAAIGDWLAGSRHAASIAAVRGAHPRHGGTGALYIILRKATPKPGNSRKN
ncbi:Smr/MutS family protein [Sphingomonas sp.]|uniref:Smr/MutS family protein n=1 Tax=Sphingomonas sp. TaxID=28214 RepID=UPI003D6D8F19